MHGMEGPNALPQVSPYVWVPPYQYQYAREMWGTQSLSPTYLGLGQVVLATWPETLALTASCYWHGPLALPTAWLGWLLLPVATSRVHWLTRRLAGLVLTASCYWQGLLSLSAACQYHCPLRLAGYVRVNHWQYK